MKIVITGANGQLGKAFQQILPEAAYVDQDKLDFTADPDEVKQKVLAMQPDVFINCGAYTNVDGAETNVDLAHKINGEAVQGIAAACKELNARLIQISTDYVLGENDGKEREESEEPDPQSIYGASKLAGEMFALEHNKTTIIRTSWLFGEGKNFVQTMLQLGKNNKEVSVVDDQIGRPTYAADLAEMIVKLLEKEELPNIIHIQNEGPAVSWAGFAEKVFEQAGMNVNVNKITTKEYIKKFSVPDKIIANRPVISVFSLKVLHGLDLGMRSWEQALVEYIKLNNF